MNWGRELRELGTGIDILIDMTFLVSFSYRYATESQIGKTGRKDRERERTQDDGMTYVNISIPVPKLPVTYSWE